MPSDANGVYSLPIGYLAVTGNTIQPSQHNPPLEDIAAALTARLSANGANPMTGPLKLSDGAVGAPALTFNTAQTTGFYKTAGGNIAISIGGTESVEFGAAGIVTGARFLGELIPYTCTAAPALCVLPFGQTLSRVTYAALWAQAQIEIAAGNTFYNNGDGSTTFGIADLRGRVPAAWDKMGGVASGRLTTVGGGVDGPTIGAAGGQQQKAILQTNLPNVNFTNSGIAAASTVSLNWGNGTKTSTVANQFGVGTYDAGGSNPPTAPAGLAASTTITSQGAAASGGSGTPLVTVQPTMVVNYILFAGA